MSDDSPLLAISLEAKFNASRSVVFQTHVPLDSDPKEIYKQFSKVCEIADRREEFYLIRGLEITLKRDEEQYRAQQNSVATLEQSYHAENTANPRRGDGSGLRHQQKANVENQRGSLKALKDRMDQTKSQIAELTELQKAYK